MKITKERLSKIIKEEVAIAILEISKLDERKPLDSERGPGKEDPLEEEETLKEDDDALEEGELGDYTQKEMEKDRYGWPTTPPAGTPRHGRSSSYSPPRGNLYEPSKPKKKKEMRFRWDENKKLTKETIRRAVEETLKELAR